MSRAVATASSRPRKAARSRATAGPANRAAREEAPANDEAAAVEQVFLPGAPNLKLSAPEVAVRAIQDLIRRNGLQPGARLPSQRQLSNELNVSRASLREALSTLEALRLVRTSAGRGTFVCDAVAAQEQAISDWRFSERFELREVYEFRYLVEAAAVRLAAVTITDEELTELKMLHAEFKAKLKARDFMASAVYDFQFHRMIMVCSRNRVFVDIYEKFHKVFQQTQMLPFSRKERRWEAVVEHGKILEALQRHDPDGAAYFLEMHLLRATDRIGVKLNLPR
jgi:GntR family transcriptional repressor for pyruvate dehydrogenase complex